MSQVSQLEPEPSKPSSLFIPVRTQDYWSVSRTQTDWTCARSRFWNYHFNGTGIVPGGTSLALYLGNAVHDAVAGIATGHLTKNQLISALELSRIAYKQVYEALIADQLGITDPATETFAKEQGCLVQGLILGFHRYCWPQLLPAGAQVIAVEKEMVLPYRGKNFFAKPDLLVRTPDGALVYVEYKTTSSKKESWINSWNTSVQLHATCRVIEHTMGESPAYVIVQGLYKGYESYGKQSSPFCYGYARNPNPPFTTGDVRYEYTPGYKRASVWDLEGGLEGWVSGMPDHVLVEQFPRTPPIFINEDLVTDFLDQRTLREQEIDLALDLLDMLEPSSEAYKQVLHAAFPQKFSQCVPSFGSPCPYRSLCFNPGQDPFALGFQVKESAPIDWETLTQSQEKGMTAKESV